MVKYTYYCDCCGKEIKGDDMGSFKLHYHSWGGGSMGGTEDEHHYECDHLCMSCVSKLEQTVKSMDIKKQHKYDR